MVAQHDQQGLDIHTDRRSTQHNDCIGTIHNNIKKVNNVLEDPSTSHTSFIKEN